MAFEYPHNFSKFIRDSISLPSLRIAPQISISSGVITSYAATLIANFGFTPPISALLNMPSGIVSISSTLIVGYGVRYTSNRWVWIAGCCAPGILGGALMSFLPSTNRAGLLAGIYLVNSIVAILAVVYQWTAANIAGQTKRAATSCLIAACFSVGNIIGPQTFRNRDAPQYIPAKISVLATQTAAAFLAFGLFLYYKWANSRKESVLRAKSELEGPTNLEERRWENLTDKENMHFRYVY